VCDSFVVASWTRAAGDDGNLQSFLLWQAKLRGCARKASVDGRDTSNTPTR
jgi:hypothetical protein